MATDTSTNILVIDDERHICSLISQILEKAGHTVSVANSGNAGLEMFRQNFPGAVILDLNMPDMNGIEVLKRIKALDSKIPVIIITAYGEVRSAVEAIKLGAYDYLNKPFVNEDIVLTVDRALREDMMRQEIHALKTQLSLAMPLSEQMGFSNEIEKLNELVARIAPTNFTVVIYGETGSGKEVVARHIHDKSARKGKPFVVVDCGSIPEGLIESELFGCEKGAFTGADKKRPGQFEMASGGTLFLDEIGNIAASVQGKLLRVLQERKLRRLGSNKEIEIDVRIIAAGNERLEHLIQQGRFRMDLYQRLSEFYLEVPPLRERKDDVVFLCKRFLDITNKELGKRVRGISHEALQTLLSYDWPGNVRELRNVIRRAVLLAADTIRTRHISFHTPKPNQTACREQGRKAGKQPQRITLSNSPASTIDFEKDFSFRDVVAGHVEDVEKMLLTEALKHTGGNKNQASRLLKIDYKTIHNKIKKYGIT